MRDFLQFLRETSYPGRGIVLGKTADGKQSVAAYFIMGRSENSRNRVFVKTDDGIVGYGEATTMPEWGGNFGRYYGESYETTEVVIRDNLFPAIVGMDPFDIDLIHHRMDKAIRGFVYAKAAIDIALYDIMGKALDKPVYKLLGGQHRKAIPIAHSLGVVLDIEAAVDEAVAACGEGIKTIKMKGGLDPVRDMELMEKLRKAVGPHINILVDANQGYPPAKDAIK